MRVLIVAPYSQTPEEKGNQRFNYIADLLGKDKRNNVELIMSSFSHKMKKQKNTKDNEIKKLNYKVTFIYEPGYEKNISLKRFYSHYILSKNLKKYLEKLNYIPDVIYCSVPILDCAKTIGKYTQGKNVRFIIDVQDLWPEAFRMVFNIPILSKIIFLPFEKEANSIYKNADDIVAVSETYLNRACKVNTKKKHTEVVFLGTDLEKFDSFKEKINDKGKNDKIKICYIGTLGHSYNIKKVIDAMCVLKDKYKENNVEFIVMGDGPLKKEFELYNKNKKAECKFLGRLPYNEMVKKLCECDIAINPIKKKSAASIINKVGDYAATGLPVINTQESQEYRNIVEKYNIGYNCDGDNEYDIAEKIEKLIKDEQLRKEMGKNNRKLAEEKFDRNKTYSKIVKLIMGEE